MAESIAHAQRKCGAGQIGPPRNGKAARSPSPSQNTAEPGLSAKPEVEPVGECYDDADREQNRSRGTEVMGSRVEVQAQGSSVVRARLMRVADLSFSDLPLIQDQTEMRLVHRTTDLFFVKRGGTAHAEMDCGHLEPDTMVGKPNWRIATGGECRKLAIPWCESCCT